MPDFYRVGNHQPQNVYRGDAYIGVMFTAEDAALAVEALNGRAAPGPCPESIDTGMTTPYLRRCELLAGHDADHKDGGMRWWDVADERKCWHGNTCPGGGLECGPPEDRP